MSVCRQLPPSFLLPAWCKHQLRQLRAFRQTPWSRSHIGKSNSEKTISLLDELFPEEARQDNKEKLEAEANKEKIIPRLPIPKDLDDLDKARWIQDPDGKPRRLRFESLTRQKAARLARQWPERYANSELAILVVRNASKSLVEDDFRRVIPQGQHIEGWTGQGDILKVIPGRDPKTLEQLGNYFLLFASIASARAYHEHVIRLHRLSQALIPDGLFSATPITPGYTFQGQDVHALLQSYTIIPPSQKLNMRLVVGPFSPSMKKLIGNGGYSPIVRQSGMKRSLVRFWVEGFNPPLKAMRDMIAKDGSARGLAWALSGEEDNIQKLDTSSFYSEDETDMGSKNFERKLGREQCIWLIAFKDEIEARRFARSWHKRAFPLLPDVSALDESESLVNVEYIW